MKPALSYKDIDLGMDIQLYLHKSVLYYSSPLL